MPVWGWILIAAMVIVVVIAGVLVMAMPASRRKRTERLKQKFGPEYERTVSEAGEQQAAEKELVAREHKRDKLDIHPLTAGAREGYAHRWRTVQTAFVDHPSSAVGDADRLVTEVMRERGYPVDDFDQRAADISVDHPVVVDHYRAAQAIAVRGERGEADTEELRTAVVHYRALFNDLLGIKEAQQGVIQPTQMELQP